MALFCCCLSCHDRGTFLFFRHNSFFVSSSFTPSSLPCHHILSCALPFFPPISTGSLLDLLPFSSHRLSSIHFALMNSDASCLLLKKPICVCSPSPSTPLSFLFFYPPPLASSFFFFFEFHRNVAEQSWAYSFKVQTNRLDKEFNKAANCREESPALITQHKHN